MPGKITLILLMISIALGGFLKWQVEQNGKLSEELKNASRTIETLDQERGALNKQLTQWQTNAKQIQRQHKAKTEALQAIIDKKPAEDCINADIPGDIIRLLNSTQNNKN